MAVLRADQVRSELIYRLCEQPLGLRVFSKEAWSIIEPATPIIWSWFHDAICDHLEAVTHRHIQQLIINIPPRFMKSTLTAIDWPCWEWGPMGLAHRRWIFSSYAQSLSERDSQRRRMVMSSAWYRAGWGHVFEIGRQRFMPDGQLKYQNDHMGYHLSTSVGGSNTGEGGDTIVYDDPHNMNEIHSEIKRQAVLRWKDEVMFSRLNDRRPGGGAEVLIMQRGHEEDLTGHLLKQGGWTWLCLPNEYEPKHKCQVFIGGRIDPETGHRDPTDPGLLFFEDPRTEPDELLYPERFPLATLQQLKAQGTYVYSSQYQQRPSPAGGGILKEAWWRYWVPFGHPLAHTLDENGHLILQRPSRFDQTMHSWDMAFKSTKTSSFVCGQAWGRLKAQAYLLDWKHDRMDFLESLYAVRDLRKHHPTQAIYVEDKANGPAIINVLQQDIPAILPGELDASDGGKIARAYAAQPKLQAGNFALPHPETLSPERRAELLGMIHECNMFPNSAYSDRVDAFTQAHKYLYLEGFDADNFGHAGSDLVQAADGSLRQRDMGL